MVKKLVAFMREKKEWRFFYEGFYHTILGERRNHRKIRIEKGIIVLGYAGFTLFICLIAISIANLFK